MTTTLMPGILINLMLAIAASNSQKYWTYEQQTPSEPRHKLQTKRFPLPQRKQVFTELNLDTGKLYSQLVDALARDKKTHVASSQPDRRANVNSPSLLNFDKPILEGASVRQRGADDQTLAQRSPSGLAFDPFWTDRGWIGDSLNNPSFATQRSASPATMQASPLQLAQPPPPPAPSPPPPPLLYSTPPQAPLPQPAAPQQALMFQPPASSNMQRLPQAEVFVAPSDIAPILNSFRGTSPSAGRLQAASQALPLSPVDYGHPTDEGLANPEGYDIQSFTADVVPDGKGGMKVIPDNNINVNAPHSLKASSKAQKKNERRPQIGKPILETVLNNPRNTQTAKEPAKKKPATEAAKRVYSLGDHVFTDIGCFFDKWMRAIPTLEGNHPLLMDPDYKSRTDPLQKCAEASLDKGFRVFALQNGGQCFAGVNGENRYHMYGPIDTCKDDGLGGPWSSEVYMFEEDLKPVDHSPHTSRPSFNKPIPTQHRAGGGRNDVSDDDSIYDYDKTSLKDDQDFGYDDTARYHPSPTKPKPTDPTPPKPKPTEPSAQGQTFRGILGKIISKAVNESKQRKIVETPPPPTTQPQTTRTTTEQPTTTIATTTEVKTTESNPLKAVKELLRAAIKGDTKPNISTTNSYERTEMHRPLPLGAQVAKGGRPPCICPDKLCSSKLDLAFVIDASAGSEQGGKDKMAEVMEFGRRVASAFKVSPDDSRIGLVTYATDAQIMMNFHRFSDPEALTEARDAVRVKPHTGKYTGQALSLAKEGLFEKGHRPDALDVLVLMTDGPASDDVTMPSRALRDMGVKLISVGIGNQVDKAMLRDVASDPDEEHVFTADFDSLGTIIRKVQKAACVGGVLRDPVNPCSCDLGDAKPDAETVAFYNIYEASVEAPRYVDVDSVRYDNIPTPNPINEKREKVRPFPVVRTLPMDNPHPQSNRSPLEEVSLLKAQDHSEKNVKAAAIAAHDDAEYLHAVETSPDEYVIAADQGMAQGPLAKPIAYIDASEQEHYLRQEDAEEPGKEVKDSQDLYNKILSDSTTDGKKEARKDSRKQADANYNEQNLRPGLDGRPTHPQIDRWATSQEDSAGSSDGASQDVENGKASTESSQHNAKAGKLRTEEYENINPDRAQGSGSPKQKPSQKFQESMGSEATPDNLRSSSKDRYVSIGSRVNGAQEETPSAQKKPRVDSLSIQKYTSTEEKVEPIATNVQSKGTSDKAFRSQGRPLDGESRASSQASPTYQEQDGSSSNQKSGEKMFSGRKNSAELQNAPDSGFRVKDREIVNDKQLPNKDFHADGNEYQTNPGVADASKSDSSSSNSNPQSSSGQIDSPTSGNSPDAERQAERLPDSRYEQTLAEGKQYPEGYLNRNPTENRADEYRADQSRADENRADENRANKNKADENRANENRADENRADEDGKIAGSNVKNLYSNRLGGHSGSEREREERQKSQNYHTAENLQGQLPEENGSSERVQTTDHADQEIQENHGQHKYGHTSQTQDSSDHEMEEGMRYKEPTRYREEGERNEEQSGKEKLDGPLSSSERVDQLGSDSVEKDYSHLALPDPMEYEMSRPKKKKKAFKTDEYTASEDNAKEQSKEAEKEEHDLYEHLQLPNSKATKEIEELKEKYQNSGLKVNNKKILEISEKQALEEYRRIQDQQAVGNESNSQADATDSGDDTASKGTRDSSSADSVNENMATHLHNLEAERVKGEKSFDRDEQITNRLHDKVTENNLRSAKTEAHKSAHDDNVEDSILHGRSAYYGEAQSPFLDGGRQLTQDDREQLAAIQAELAKGDTVDSDRKYGSVLKQAAIKNGEIQLYTVPSVTDRPGGEDDKGPSSVKSSRISDDEQAKNEAKVKHKDAESTEKAYRETKNQNDDFAGQAKEETKVKYAENTEKPYREKTNKNDDFEDQVKKETKAEFAEKAHRGTTNNHEEFDEKLSHKLSGDAKETSNNFKESSPQAEVGESEREKKPISVYEVLTSSSLFRGQDEQTTTALRDKSASDGQDEQTTTALRNTSAPDETAEMLKGLNGEVELAASDKAVNHVASNKDQMHSQEYQSGKLGPGFSRIRVNIDFSKPDEASSTPETHKEQDSVEKMPYYHANQYIPEERYEALSKEKPSRASASIISADDLTLKQKGSQQKVSEGIDDVTEEGNKESPKSEKHIGRFELEEAEKQNKQRDRKKEESGRSHEDREKAFADVEKTRQNEREDNPHADHHNEQRGPAEETMSSRERENAKGSDSSDDQRKKESSRIQAKIVGDGREESESEHEKTESNRGKESYEDKGSDDHHSRHKHKESFDSKDTKQKNREEDWASKERENMKVGEKERERFSGASDHEDALVQDRGDKSQKYQNQADRDRWESDRKDNHKDIDNDRARVDSEATSSHQERIDQINDRKNDKTRDGDDERKPISYAKTEHEKNGRETWMQGKTDNEDSNQATHGKHGSNEVDNKEQNESEGIPNRKVKFSKSKEIREQDERNLNQNRNSEAKEEGSEQEKENNKDGNTEKESYTRKGKAKERDDYPSKSDDTEISGKQKGRNKSLMDPTSEDMRTSRFNEKQVDKEFKSSRDQSSEKDLSDRESSRDGEGNRAARQDDDVKSDMIKNRLHGYGDGDRSTQQGKSSDSAFSGEDKGERNDGKVLPTDRIRPSPSSYIDVQINKPTGLHSVRVQLLHNIGESVDDIREKGNRETSTGTEFQEKEGARLSNKNENEMNQDFPKENRYGKAKEKQFDRESEYGNALDQDGDRSDKSEKIKFTSTRKGKQSSFSDETSTSLSSHRYADKERDAATADEKIEPAHSLAPIQKFESSTQPSDSKLAPEAMTSLHGSAQQSVASNSKPDSDNPYSSVGITRPGGPITTQTSKMDPESVALMKEAEETQREMEQQATEMEKDMNSFSPSLRSHMRIRSTTETGQSRHHIARKADPKETDPVDTREVTRAEDANVQEKNAIALEETNAGKRDYGSKSKGLLVNDPFLDATHYWPFDKQHGPLSMDVISGHNAIFMEGALIDHMNSSKANQCSHSDCPVISKAGYASTEKPGAYIIAGDFKGTCFCDPGKCILGGMTLSFWVNLNESKIKEYQDAYIISSGGQTKKSRGFAFLYFHGKYVFILGTSDTQWKMTIDSVPNNCWINVAFAWDKHEKLIYYLNGEAKQSVSGRKKARPKVNFSILTIGKPNNAKGNQYMFPLDMMSLALWDRPLKSSQIKHIYQSIKEMKFSECSNDKRTTIANQTSTKKHVISKPVSLLLERL